MCRSPAVGTATASSFSNAHIGRVAYLVGGGLNSLISAGSLDRTVPAREVCDALGVTLNDIAEADEALGRCAWSATTCSVMDSRRGFSGRGRLKYPSVLDVFFGEISEFDECDSVLNGEVDGADMMGGSRVSGHPAQYRLAFRPMAPRKTVGVRI